MREKDQVIPELNQRQENKPIHFYLGPFDIPSMMQILSREISEEKIAKESIFKDDEVSDHI